MAATRDGNLCICMYKTRAGRRRAEPAPRRSLAAAADVQVPRTRFVSSGHATGAESTRTLSAAPSTCVPFSTQRWSRESRRRPAVVPQWYAPRPPTMRTCRSMFISNHRKKGRFDHDGWQENHELSSIPTCRF